MNYDDIIYPYNFSVQNYAEDERFEAWRAEHQHHNLSVNQHDIAITDANFRGIHLGPMMLGNWRLTSTRKNKNANFAKRMAETIRKDSLDHYYFRLSLTDSWSYSGLTHQVEVKAAQLAMLDLSQPYDMGIADGEVIMLMVPRDILPQDVSRFHGAVFNSGLGYLFAEHLKALFRTAPQLSVLEIPLAMETTLSFLQAMLVTSPDNLRHASLVIQTALFQKIRAFIDQNLESVQLNVLMICQQMGISRSHLYRVFEEVGGVANFIILRRLAKAHAILSAGRVHKPRISELAFRYGFSSPIQFSRAYKRRFGYTPSDTLAASEQLVRASLETSHEGSAWLLPY